MSVLKTIVISLAGITAVNLTGLGVNLAFGRDINLVIDGETTVLSVVQGSVAELLSHERIQLEARDRVTPDLETPISDNMTITVSHARPLHLTFNGVIGDYWTRATTVAALVDSLGLSSSSLKLSSPLNTPIPREGISLTIRKGYTVSVTAGGETRETLSFGAVRDALIDLGVSWDYDDIITPELGTALSDHLNITVIEVTKLTSEREIAIPHATEDSLDPDSPKGEVLVVTKGVDGVKTETLRQIFHDGEIVEETVVSERITREPVTAVTVTGTKPLPTFNVSPGSAQEIAYGMVKARGWDDGQFQCLVNLWNRESGWNVHAGNASGAYGIPQALPGSKMASAGPDWQNNPTTQITWGLGYIAGRYGNPCGAWNHFLANNWY